MDKEYTNDLVYVIETVYGEGFLSQGNEQSTLDMLCNVELKHKNLLDIGCGLGGPAITLAKHEPILTVTGVDVDSDLIARAKIMAQKNQVLANTKWLTVKPNAALPFADNSFDIVFGKESWLHIPDKLTFFKECYRVLKPGGMIVSHDWMHTRANYSTKMKAFVEVDGLTFHLTTIAKYLQLLAEAGFAITQVLEKSADALAHSQKDVAFFTGEHREKLISQMGIENYQAYLACWQSQVEIFESGEMQACLVHAVKN
jgi:ubiquinone/menaquinone biosynthesis C-methylase UbiE